MGRVSKRPHQARLPEIGRRPHQAGRVYMRTRPVMAMGGARGALVCRVWHVCGVCIGGVCERVGGAWVARVGACVAHVSECVFVMS
jgi:hypothetical protein